jgi:lipoyl-dependent peroxiredoxin
MNKSEPTYTTRAQVNGGRNGHGHTEDGKLDVALRMPPELGGDGAGTNPEQLFAVGYAACFATVLSMLGRRDGLDADDVGIAAAVHLVPVGDGTFELAVELDVSLPSISEPADAAALVRKAHQICPYSRATRGNIETAFRVNGVAVPPSGHGEGEGE